jgi:uncharacterized membrane protein
MNFAALTSAAPIIQAHAYAAFVAVGLGAAQLSLPKGVGVHRALGWIWAAAMMGVAASSLFIHSLRIWGPFSPIHVLSLWTLIGVPLAVNHARRGRVPSHRFAMIFIYVAALIVTGLFTLWPGRIMHKVVFGG